MRVVSNSKNKTKYEKGSLENKEKYASGYGNVNRKTITSRGMEIQRSFADNLIGKTVNNVETSVPNFLFLSTTFLTLAVHDDFISLLSKSNIITGDYRLKTLDYVDFTPQIVSLAQEYLKTHDSIFKPEFDFLSSKVVPVLK